MKNFILLICVLFLSFDAYAQPLLVGTNTKCGAGLTIKKDVNGKHYYSGGRNTEAQWTGNQWEYSEGGVVYATNSVNTGPKAPCSEAFPWTLTAAGKNTCFGNGPLDVKTNCTSTPPPLSYGDVIHLQNGWNNYGGGYLDTRGYQKHFEKTGNFLCVSTSTASNRDIGSGKWKVMSATGKANGSPVLVGDVVHLFNQWNGNGGYLDTRGYQRDFEKTGNHLCVSTATAANRDSGSGTWKISSAKGVAAGTAVGDGSEIHLQNGWNNFQGGYLDTRGYQRDFEKTGNHLCTSTATSANRDSGSGTWKVKAAK